MHVVRLKPMPMVAWLLLALTGLVPAAQAVEFDEKLRAPMARDGAALRSRLQGYTALVERLHSVSRETLVRDKASFRDRFDAIWSLERAIDRREPLPELAEFGFEARADGGYDIDMLKHPEWRPLDEQLFAFSHAGIFDGFRPELLARGFRESDLGAMQSYLAARDVQVEQRRANLPLILSAAKVAKKYQKLNMPISDDFLMNYIYQRSLNAAQVQRQWAEGLLDTVDAQRQRILASVLSENAGVLWISPSPLQAGLAYERQLLLKPDLEQLLKQEIAGARQ